MDFHKSREHIFFVIPKNVYSFFLITDWSR